MADSKSNQGFHTAAHRGIKTPVWPAALIIWLTLTHCVPSPPAMETGAADKPETVPHLGFQVQRFATAEQQLRYALGWFEDPGEKRAALEVLLAFFPEPRRTRAQAELELAYLELGADYRFADRNACLKAVEHYNRILSIYADLSSICAKAEWRLGWIHTDLLDQPQAGLAHYRAITARYPDAQVRIEPPVPWIGLVLPHMGEDAKPLAAYERLSYPWAAMALLEIVRHTPDPEEQNAALAELLTDHGDSLAAVYALKIALDQSAPQIRGVVEQARTLLDKKQISFPLRADIAAALARLAETATFPGSTP